jgi:hypothetical protein
MKYNHYTFSPHNSPIPIDYRWTGGDFRVSGLPWERFQECLPGVFCYKDESRWTIDLVILETSPYYNCLIKLPHQSFFSGASITKVTRKISEALADRIREQLKIPAI